MDVETDDTLIQVSRDLRAASGGIALVAGVQRQHGESLETIVRLLTPEPGPGKDGPSLEELIGALLVRLDSQSAVVWTCATACRCWPTRWTALAMPGCAGC
jgi:hypothetical protein